MRLTRGLLTGAVAVAVTVGTDCAVTRDLYSQRRQRADKHAANAVATSAEI